MQGVEDIDWYKCTFNNEIVDLLFFRPVLWDSPGQIEEGNPKIELSNECNTQVYVRESRPAINW